MNTFLITGYPRSRTSWIANLMTYGPSFCFHEPALNFLSPDFKTLFRSVDLPYVGICDANAFHYFDSFIELYPDSKLVVIKRDLPDVIEATSEIGLPFDKVASIHQNALKRIEAKALVVDFNDFSPEEVWDYCVPDHPIDQVRLAMLNKFFITSIPFHRLQLMKQMMKI